MSELNDKSVRNFEEVEKEATKLGLKLVLPQGNELTLDIDTPYAIGPATPNYTRVMDCMKRNGISIESVHKTRSKSGNMHVWIRLDRYMDEQARIALQAALGSDPIRETLSLIRSQKDCEVTIALFETVEAAMSIDFWRSGL